MAAVLPIRHNIEADTHRNAWADLFQSIITIREQLDIAGHRRQTITDSLGKVWDVDMLREEVKRLMDCPPFKQ